LRIDELGVTVCQAGSAASVTAPRSTVWAGFFWQAKKADSRIARQQQLMALLKRISRGRHAHRPLFSF
jgi:hypothetical protein